ncbi:MAG: DNA translocase FtsK [Anaerolineae bacterium]|nr:DNA translocase FtsK [Anaerolineae bacterium]
MSTHKPRARATPKSEPKPSKPLLRLDPDRWEEIIAIVVIILAALTALGAFNLSGGVFLTVWTQLLRSLFGWGVFLAPLLLLGLGLWLILDALDKTWNLGWERPIGIALMYFIVLMLFQWLSTPLAPTSPPIGFQGGGIIGWVLLSMLIGALGEIGAVLALVALTGITLILLFNISLPEFARRAMYLARILRNLPREVAQFRTARAKRAPIPPPTRRETMPPPAPRADVSPPPPPAPTPPPPTPSVTPRAPVTARIIGGGLPTTTVPTTPTIPREWRLPDITEILEESAENEINQHEIRERVHKIEETLAHFGVPAKVLEVNQGPTITQFGVEPGFVEQKGADGQVHRVKVKVSRISALQHDLELALAAAPIRIEAPVPGKSLVGIEVPNSQVARVSLRSVMESETFKAMKSKLKIALGQDVAGQPICANLETMPHLLIAGATGSGKSVCVNSIIACLLCTTTPDEVQFVMVDPKRVELVNFNGIPHLREPVVVEADKAVEVLQSAVAEMDRRFRLFAKIGVRNIDTYNHMVAGQPDQERLPYLIIIVDELADLMIVAAEEVEKAITRLAQMARATGIHLILATQRPSVDVVTGLIKANFPARISFAVTSQIDSRVVLDTPGAEKLLGRGDMLYMASDSSKLVRLQGCFVSDRELERLVNHWKSLMPPPTESPTTVLPSETKYVQPALWRESNTKAESSEDDLLPQAIEVVQQYRRASVSLLQRKLRIGYSRAARLMSLLEARGIVGPDEGPTKGRAVLTTDDRRPKTDVRAQTKESVSQAASRRFEEDDFSDWTEKDWEDLDKD